MFTKTEQRMLDVLSDGYIHKKDELKRCMDDELAGPTALQFHISNIRKKLRPHGQDIICTHLYEYRQVRLLHS